MSEILSSKKRNEDWMNSKWRPMMGWMYMLVCTMDFVVFPILWSIIQALGGGRVETQWSPITLQGAGLFHMAMGAVLGVTAWSRGQEKLAGANNGGAQVPATRFTPGLTTTSAPSAGGFGNSSGFNSPTQSTSWRVPPTATTADGKTIVPVGNEPEL